MSAINQLIAQGFGSPMGGGQGSSGYANALASMRNAQLQHQMQREKFAFEKQKFDAEQAALQRAVQSARENQLAAASYNFAGSTSPTEVLAYGEPGQNALTAYYKQQEVLNKQAENALARESFNAGKSGRDATARKTLADAAEMENKVSSQIEQDAVNLVLGMSNLDSAMTALKQLTTSGRISEPKARQLADNMGAYPSMDALRKQFDIRGLTPQQRLEQKTRSADLGGIRREITENPYGVGDRKTEDMSVTMTPAQVAESTRANIAESRLQRQEEWTRQTDRWTKDREDQKLELDRQRTRAVIAKDKSAQEKSDLESQKLQSEIDEAKRLKEFINETGFDLNDPEDRKKLSTSEQGRAILKSNDDLQTSNINRQIGQINLELKNQELAQNEEESFVGKLGIATTADSLRSLFDSAFNNPVLAKELEKDGVTKDELDKLLSGLTTPEQVKNFVREFQSQALADNKVAKERLANQSKSIQEYEYAVGQGYKGSFEDFLLLGKSEKTKLPDDVREYEYAVGQGYKGSFEDWQLKNKKAGATTISQVVNTSQEKKFEEGLGTFQAKRIEENQGKAIAAAEVIETGNIGKRLLEEGTLSGFGAEFMTKAGEALHRLGFNVGSDAVSNTRAYAATMGKSVASLIKQFGAGTGLSDADREYASLMAGGNIALDAKSLRKIIDINERASRNVIRKYNASVKGIKSVTPLTIDEPPEYKSRKQQKKQSSNFPAAGTVEDGYRFKGGNPSDPANWEKQ